MTQVMNDPVEGHAFVMQSVYPHVEVMTQLAAR